jgi:hypothetical protein
MAHYLIYQQGSFLLKERFENALDGVARTLTLPSTASCICLFDFDSAPLSFLELMERAMDREDLAPHERERSGEGL